MAIYSQPNNVLYGASPRDLGGNTALYESNQMSGGARARKSRRKPRRKSARKSRRHRRTVSSR